VARKRVGRVGSWLCRVCVSLEVRISPVCPLARAADRTATRFDRTRVSPGLHQYTQCKLRVRTGTPSPHGRARPTTRFIPRPSELVRNFVTRTALRRRRCARLSAPLRAAARSRPIRHNFGLGLKPAHTTGECVRRACGGRQPAAHTQPASVRRAAAARFRTRCWQWECA